VLLVREIIIGIVKELHKFLGRPIVPTDTASRRPNYPYVSYKIINSQDAAAHALTDEAVDSTDPRFNYDVLTTRTEQPIFTMSINSYSMDEGEAYALAARARDWFIFYSDLYFVDLNIVTIGATIITDRTQQVVEDYERRYGFDVRIRAARAITKRVETIESFLLDGAVK
jgi:hypothetical protein